MDISEKNKRVCIFGQGYVGLPLALSFAFRGCETIGVDVDKSLVENIDNGVTHHTEEFDGITIQDILHNELSEKRYNITVDGASAVKECNNIIVTVGIPIKNGKCIMDYLESACIVIGENLKKDDLIIIRSTVIPGTTENFILPILERESGLKAGEDFYIAYSSERIAEGKAFDEFANMPTLVAGINSKSCERAVDLLSIVCKAEIVKASCIKAVETSKVFENVQRDVNIAMSQEFARFTEALGIDVFEVIKLANTHKRVNLLMPGPGVGGFCIPNAYHYIAPKAEELDVNMELLRISREKNSQLPQFIVNKTVQLLSEIGKDIENSKIAVLGLAMKDYSSDDRISPSVDICKMLLEIGANVVAFDPTVSTKYEFKMNSQEEALKNADVVLVLAKQNLIKLDDVKYISRFMNDRPILIDAKGIIDRVEAEKFGIRYWRI
ncbi:nucleotide sugar dehydrogenase [Clostridium sp. CX1]|nr:nucleotide sugar dehydrogenase [Clostridium sp. CX1]